MRLFNSCALSAMIWLIMTSCNAGPSSASNSHINPPKDLEGYVNTPTELAAWELYRDSIIMNFAHTYEADSLSVRDSVVLLKQLELLPLIMPYFDLSAFEGIDVRSFLESYEDNKEGDLIKEVSRRVEKHIKGDTMQILTTASGIQGINFLMKVNFIAGRMINMNGVDYMQEYLRINEPELFHPLLLAEICLSMYVAELDQKQRGWDTEVKQQFEQEFKTAHNRIKKSYSF